MNNYPIRIASPADVLPALELARRVFMEYEAPFYPEGAAQKFIGDCVENPGYIANYTSGQHLMYVALEGGRMAGMVCERGGGRISMLFVEGEYHRRGIAMALMDKIIPMMRSDKITLHSSPYALPFYKKYGFCATGPEQNIDGFIVTPMRYEPGEL